MKRRLEAQATRDVRLTGVNWTTPYAAINGTDALATMESTVQVKQSETGTWKSWTLTNAVQFWLADPNSNHGVILWTPDEDLDGYDMRFRSSEHTNKPKLDVVWSNQPKTVYFLKDHLGSVRATVLDSAGAPVVAYSDYDPWGYILAKRDTAHAVLPAATRNKFIGKEWDDDYGVNWLHFPYRSYDPEIARWLVRDPLAIKYPGWSSYSYALNNPLIVIDFDGRDVIILNDQQAAYGFGHNAILIGNDKTGWVYYSKDGRANDGRSEYTRKSFRTFSEFVDSKSSQRYDEGAWFETSEKQDKAAQDYAEEAVKTEYDRVECNCADLSGEAAEKAGVKIKEDKFLGVTIPNKQIQSAKKLAAETENAKVIDLDQERKKQDKEAEKKMEMEKNNQ